MSGDDALKSGLSFDSITKTYFKSSCTPPLVAMFIAEKSERFW